MRDTATQDAEIFAMHRSHLFAIAYRMLGSVMDAEDIVQESYLQWQRRGDRAIASPRALLASDCQIDAQRKVSMLQRLTTGELVIAD